MFRERFGLPVLMLSSIAAAAWSSCCCWRALRAVGAGCGEGGGRERGGRESHTEMVEQIFNKSQYERLYYHYINE